jgi:flavin-dependent dehydrogenase
MKVAIAGAGLTGAYLYRRLEKTCDVQIFDRQESTRCRLTPCAWGTTPQFAAYPERCSLDPEDYIGHRSESVLLSQVPIQVSLATIDKPAFIKDLLQQTPVRYGKLDPRRFDRVIDATGLSRAFPASSTW